MKRFFGSGSAAAGDGSIKLPPNATNADPNAPPPGERKIVKASLEAMSFQPSTIEIAPGTTVVRSNEDPLQHTITASNMSFSSLFIAPDGSFAHTFTIPGTYTVICMVHPFMKATVVVK